MELPGGVQQSAENSLDELSLHYLYCKDPFDKMQIGYFMIKLKRDHEYAL